MTTKKQTWARIRYLLKQNSEDLFSVYQSIEDDEALQCEKDIVGDCFERQTEIETLMHQMFLE
jgi:hypothetical protein